MRQIEMVRTSGVRECGRLVCGPVETWEIVGVEQRVEPQNICLIRQNYFYLSKEAEFLSRLSCATTDIQIVFIYRQQWSSRPWDTSRIRSRRSRVRGWRGTSSSISAVGSPERWWTWPQSEGSRAPTGPVCICSSANPRQTMANRHPCSTRLIQHRLMDRKKWKCNLFDSPKLVKNDVLKDTLQCNRLFQSANIILKCKGCIKLWWLIWKSCSEVQLAGWRVWGGVNWFIGLVKDCRVESTNSLAWLRIVGWSQLIHWPG